MQVKPPPGRSMKTIAVRILEQAGIACRVIPYEVDEDALDAVTVARKIGFEPASVFKTLVARGDRNGVLMALVAADAELDLKKLAQTTGNKKIELVPVKELQSLTGYIRGGVSPLGSKKKFPVWLDESAILSEEISISAGQRGLQIIVAPDDLLRAVEGTYADISVSVGK